MAQASFDRISKRLNNIYKYVAVYSLGKLFGGDERFALLRESERNKSRKEVVATVTPIQGMAYVRKLVARSNKNSMRRPSDRLAGNVGLSAIIYFVFHRRLPLLLCECRCTAGR